MRWMATLQYFLMTLYTVNYFVRREIKAFFRKICDRRIMPFNLNAPIDVFNIKIHSFYLLPKNKSFHILPVSEMIRLNGYWKYLKIPSPPLQNKKRNYWNCTFYYSLLEMSNIYSSFVIRNWFKKIPLWRFEVRTTEEFNNNK